MKNNRFQIALPIFFSIAVILGMFIGYKLHSNMPNSKSFFSTDHFNKTDEVFDLIKERYVDDISLDSTTDKAIEKILSDLDPHSIYIPSSSLKEVNEDLEGQFQGIGIEFNVFNDTVHILSVLADGPAFKAGLKIGDRIISVNDSLATGNIETDKFKHWVKGPAGTSVKLKIKRDNNFFVKNINRGNIPLFSIDAAYMYNQETGYIKINRFSETTYEEFMKALEKLNAGGMKKMILDLRDNGGGILDEAVEIADEFIPNNQRIVYTEGKHIPRRDYMAKRPGLFETGKLLVLMNENSASASEVLAGALQDLDRATIIGRRSFGKGLVQEQYSLKDGSALRLTVARYYTPLGRSIQKSYKNGNESYNEEIFNRIHLEGQQKMDSIEVSKGKKFKTAKGKILYGGGGIWPDVFVGLQKVYTDSVIFKLYAKNILSNFSYRIYLEQKDKINSFSHIEDFQRNYQINDSLFNKLMRFCEINGMNFYGFSTENKKYISNRIKSLIARIKWGENGFYSTINLEDPVFQKSIAL